MKSYKKQREFYQPKVLELASSGMSVREISLLFPVSKKTIYNWIRIFASETFQDTYPMSKETSNTRKELQSYETDVDVLHARIRELETQLTMAEIKAEAYDEMINVAESMFHIQIRKKAGAKR